MRKMPQRTRCRREEAVMTREEVRSSLWADVVATVAVISAIGVLYLPLVLR